jgi:subtilase family serine protease
MGMRIWGFRHGTGWTVATAVLLFAAPAALAAGPVAGVTRLGAAPAARSVMLALPLKADEAGLERFATAVSTPGSSQYGQYESIAALGKRFGATAPDRARVLRYLRRSGATGVKVDVTGLFADATVTVSLAQRLFGTSLSEFRTAQATRYVAPTTPARIPAALRGAVTGVVGLDTHPLVTQRQVKGSSAARWLHAPASTGQFGANYESGYPSRTGTASGCAAATSQQGFTPNQYLTAYNYAPLQQLGLNGHGERVALIEIDGFRYADLRAFSTCFGLRTPAINGYGVGLSHPLPAGGESTLDLEVLDAAAPGLKAVDVYESRASAVDVLHSLTAPLNSGRKPDVISASLGSCEPATLDTVGTSGLRAAEGSLALAAASGISVLASSGDDGSSGCVTAKGQPLAGLAVSYPASSPFVTGVGGTNVALNAGNQLTNQIVWNDSPVVVAAGGGGLSGLFRRPSYQKSFVAPNHRAVPDVSMLADPSPGYEIYCTVKGDCINSQHSSPWVEVGGTSAASPLLAGGLALVDEDLRLHGRQDVGLANPLLYKIAHSPESPNVLSDVISNDNDLGASITGKPFGCCTATAGYDYASGLGSVNLAGLALVASGLVPKVVSVGLSVPGQRHPVASKHLLARVSCSGGCLVGAYTRIQLARARSRLTQYSNVFVLKRKGRRTVTIAFDNKTLGKLRTALRRRQRITATVYGAVLDPGGNVERQTRGQALRIQH